MTQIIPAILATTEKEYQGKLQKIVSSGAFEEGWVQIDLMDSKFVQNKNLLRRTLPFSDEKGKSIGLEVITKYRSPLKKEAHLMVVNPSEWIEELKQLEFNRVIGHIEVGEDEVELFLTKSKEIAMGVGLAINPETTVSTIEPYVTEVDAVLIMSVHPGKSGQEFIPETIDKIEAASRLRSKNNLNFLIGVDGGINEEVVGQLVEAGVDYLVIGSHLLEGDIDENLAKIWEKIQA